LIALTDQNPSLNCCGPSATHPRDIVTTTIDTPLPAGATSADGWQDIRNDRPFRVVFAERGVGSHAAKHHREPVRFDRAQCHRLHPKPGSDERMNATNFCISDPSSVLR
jgi:hypothetical protein